MTLNESSSYQKIREAVLGMSRWRSTGCRKAKERTKRVRAERTARGKGRAKMTKEKERTRVESQAVARAKEAKTRQARIKKDHKPYQRLRQCFLQVNPLHHHPQRRAARRVEVETGSRASVISTSCQKPSFSVNVERCTPSLCSLNVGVYCGL